ncbi:hypothetical protein QC762_0030500 [Podospora pseudocomata]|uniref:Uncharacterized protein n=1 Tax=Podospora pseudocomata TaxID=2093779 RepID=A0ABR0GPK7_9PEZI|nr:hypothetical protein QC762_0030500 [Podospora pseudocomata]
MMALPPRGLQWFAWRNDWERGWVTQELGPDGEAISLEIRHTWLIIREQQSRAVVAVPERRVPRKEAFYQVHGAHNS